MKPVLSLVLLGILGTSTAHAASAQSGMNRALRQATTAMKAAKYKSADQRRAIAALSRATTALKKRRVGVEAAMIELINNAPFLAAFDKFGGTLTLAKGNMGHELFIAVDPAGPSWGRIGLYAGIERRAGLVGEVPEWLDNNLALYPKLTAASLTRSVEAWTKQNFPKAKR
jgi:hypothetical protein